MTFQSSMLGDVQHPINLIREYLDAFGSKPKAAILSWLDSWNKSGKEWVWLVLEDLATELGWCRDTLHRHLKELLNLNVIERKLARRWPTDQAFQYRLNQDELLKHIDFQDFQIVESEKSDSGESETSKSTVQNSEIYLNQSLNQELNQTLNTDACIARGIEEIKEPEEEIPEEEKPDIRDVWGQIWDWDIAKDELETLGVDFPRVARAVKKHWKFTRHVVADVRRTIIQSQFSGVGKKIENPTGYFLFCLKMAADYGIGGTNERD